MDDWFTLALAVVLWIVFVVAFEAHAIRHDDDE